MAATHSARKVAALGRIRSIGDCYNCITDTFCDFNAFREPIPWCTVTTDIEDSKIQYYESSKISTKCRKLGVDDELKASILGGLIELEGSAKYLADYNTSSSSVSTTLQYTIRTRNDEAQISDKSVQPFLSEDVLLHNNATHVVVGIEWGATCLITLEFKNKANNNKKEIEERLLICLKEMANSNRKNRIEEFYGENKIGGNLYTMKTYADIVPTDIEIPTNFESGSKFIMGIPSALQSCNNGVGIPIFYTLVPIHVIDRNYNFELGSNLVQQINIEYLTLISNIFDEIIHSRAKIQDLYNDVKNYKYCISDSGLFSVSEWRSNHMAYEMKLSSELQSVLIKVRSGTAEASSILNMYDQYKESPYAPSVIRSELKNYSPIVDKIKLVTSLSGTNIEYLHKKDSVEILIGNKLIKTIAVLYSSGTLKSEDLELWNTNNALFHSIASNRPVLPIHIVPSKLYYVDGDVHPIQDFTNKVKISIIGDGVCIIDDLKDYLILTSCVAHSYSYMPICSTKPNNRVPIQWKCPGADGVLKSQCSSESKNWNCDKCGVPIEFGFDNHFYCECGKAPCHLYKYKCADQNHGYEYIDLQKEELHTNLAALKPKEINILLLGETGVGKSTWINGFVNYVTYKSLNDAELGSDVSLIPSSFTITNELYEEILIEMGVPNTNENIYSPDNKIDSRGQSVTQGPKSYVFPSGDTWVRLIDTPGIGDTRGLVQDRKNFEHILSHIAHFEEIHGICILLKPNNARLTTMFRFCIKELLTHLHRDATRNIIFCFTNARGTFYKPGDTLPPLRRLLSEHGGIEIPLLENTMYCIDNEAVRFLGAIKHGIKFDDITRQNYSASWDVSAKETERLIQYVEGLKPHVTRNTLSLNDARRIVLALTEPIALIGKNIATNLELMKRQKEEIESVTDTAKKMEKKLYVSVYDLEFEEINEPRTVCTSAKCIKVHKIAGNEKIDHVTICHEDCRLINVPVKRYPTPELKGCAAFRTPTNQLTDNCQKCACSWEKHMHITYKCNLVERNVINETTFKLINGAKTDLQAKQLALGSIEQQVKQMNNEKQQIVEISAKFAFFLKLNAITIYNDALLDYFEMLIAQEREVVAVGGGRNALKNLERMLEEYKQEVKLLTENMPVNATAENSLSPEDISKLTKSLFNLKINGSQFKNALQIIELTLKKSFDFQETIYSPPRYKKILNGIKKFLFDFSSNKNNSLEKQSLNAQSQTFRGSPVQLRPAPKDSKSVCNTM